MWVCDRAAGAFLAVNDAALKQYGYTREEFLALKLEALERCEGGEARPESEPASAVRWCRHRDRDGVCVDVEVFSRPVRFGDRQAQLELALDVSRLVRAQHERHRVEKALAQSEASFRAFVENAVFGMYRSTREGLFTMVNQTLVEMLGYQSAADLLQQPVPREIQLNPEVRTRLLADTGPIDVFRPREVEWRRGDGAVVVLRVSGHAVRDAGGWTMAYEAIVEDVTERRALEEQLRQSQKLEAVGLLAGGIAHDFNNHLTAILGTVELLRTERADDPELVVEMDSVKRVCELSAELIKKLLAFSRRQRLDLKVVNLPRLVEDAARMLSRVVPEHIEFKLALEPTGSTVEADTGAVEQILLNLVTNARDAMPQGGTLLLQTYATELDEAYCHSQGWDSPGHYVVLAVSDTGIGMDEATRRRAFEPFFTTKPLGSGTGLGLPSVYGLAKQHGGMAHIYSEPGHGTSVKVYFPAVASAEPAATPATATLDGLAGNETVLLAEDETRVRRAARRILEKFGYTVIEAADGADALERYRERKDDIALVLTDVVMPRLGGPQLVAAMRSEGYLGPVLYTSGYTARDIEQAAILDPGVPLLPKPWTIPDLLGRVRRSLGRQATA
jgi:PAS domain S-box-containing protein